MLDYLCYCLYCKLKWIIALLKEPHEVTCDPFSHLHSMWVLLLPAFSFHTQSWKSPYFNIIYVLYHFLHFVHFWAYIDVESNFHVVLSTFALRKFHSETHAINSVNMHFSPVTISFVMMNAGCLAPPKHVGTAAYWWLCSVFWVRSAVGRPDLSAPKPGVYVAVGHRVYNPCLSNVSTWSWNVYPDIDERSSLAERYPGLWQLQS